MDIYWKRVEYICAVCILVFSITGAGWYVKNHNYKLLQSAQVLAENEDYVCGLDIDGDIFRLFRVKKEDGKQEFLDYPAVKDGYYVSLQDCVMDENGRVYITVVLDSESETKIHTGICDFETKEIRLQQDIVELFTKESKTYVGSMIVNQNELGIILGEYMGGNMPLSLYVLKEDGGYELYKKLSDFEAAGAVLMGEDLSVLRIDQAGNLYKAGDNGQDQMIFCNDGSQIGRGCFTYGYENGLLKLWDTELEKGYQIFTDGRSGQIILDTSGKDSLGYRSFILENGRKVLASGADDALTIIDRIEMNTEAQRVQWLRLSGVGMFCGYLYLALFCLLRRKKGGMPVWGYMVLTIIPFAAMGNSMLFKVVDKHMELFYEKTQAVQLAQMGRDFKALLDLDKFEMYASYEALNTEQNVALRLPTSEMPVIYETEGEERQYQWSTYARPELFYYKNGVFTAAGTMHYQLNLPMEYQCDSKMLKAMTMAAEQRQEVYVSFADNNGEWGRHLFGRTLTSECGAVFSPVEGTDNQVIGVLGTIVNNGADIQKNSANKQTIKDLIRFITLGLLTTVLLILYLKMKPLRKLNNAVLSLTENRLNAPLKIKGNSEIASLSLSFNRIVETTRQQVQQMEAYEKRYKAFLPESLFPLLKKRGIQSIAVGDIRQIWGTVLAMDICDTEGEKKHDIISYVNKCLAVQVPQLKAGGGIILRFANTGTETIFVGEERKQVLSTVVSTIQSGSQLLEEGRLCAGIVEGTMDLGIMGSGKRNRIAVMASQKKFSWFLQQLAKECGATVLITAKAAESIADFRTGYHYRTLGYIYLSAQQELELIYEIFDGDRDEARRKKMVTRDLFEAGVTAFMTNQVSQARRCFIKVVDHNKDDKAAIKYIHLCENYLEKRQEQELLCLEIY